mmetsp:Transcript_2404/g.6698  ORF Transcript_2404/g.6698 Transcript_2404/m.6698 type:complete len:210 (+) Transcript_2404:715-1344(+)
MGDRDFRAHFFLVPLHSAAIGKRWWNIVCIPRTFQQTRRRPSWRGRRRGSHERRHDHIHMPRYFACPQGPLRVKVYHQWQLAGIHLQQGRQGGLLQPPCLHLAWADIRFHFLLVLLHLGLRDCERAAGSWQFLQLRRCDFTRAGHALCELDVDHLRSCGSDRFRCCRQGFLQHVLPNANSDPYRAGSCRKECSQEDEHQRNGRDWRQRA